MTGNAERGSSFYLGFLFLPRAKRAALAALYAFCRQVDDVADSGAYGPDEARQRLDFWRGEIDRLFEGRPTHPVARGLAPHVAAFRLPRESFLEIVRGCEMDLDKRRYRTIEDLQGYMARVASSVGLAAVEIFGYRHTPAPRVREFAVLFGYAFQLTNIIRDVGEDLRLGRVYLPEQELESAGLSPADLPGAGDSPAFLSLMRLQYSRAKGYYAEARRRLDPRDRPAMIAAEVMAHVYEGVLERIRQEDYPVLRRRVSLSRWRKAACAARAWLYCRGWTNGKP